MRVNGINCVHNYTYSKHDSLMGRFKDSLFYESDKFHINVFQEAKTRKASYDRSARMFECAICNKEVPHQKAALTAHFDQHCLTMEVR